MFVQVIGTGMYRYAQECTDVQIGVAAAYDLVL